MSTDPVTLSRADLVRDFYCERRERSARVRRHPDVVMFLTSQTLALRCMKPQFSLPHRLQELHRPRTASEPGDSEYEPTPYAAAGLAGLPPFGGLARLFVYRRYSCVLRTVRRMDRPRQGSAARQPSPRCSRTTGAPSPHPRGRASPKGHGRALEGPDQLLVFGGRSLFLARFRVDTIRAGWCADRQAVRRDSADFQYPLHDLSADVVVSVPDPHPRMPGARACVGGTRSRLRVGDRFGRVRKHQVPEHGRRVGDEFGREAGGGDAGRVKSTRHKRVYDLREYCLGAFGATPSRADLLAWHATRWSRSGFFLYWDSRERNSTYRRYQ